MYIKYIQTVYTENFNWIYIVYAMNNTGIFHVYTSVLAGQGRGTSLAPQIVSCKRLDEILPLYAVYHTIVRCLP